MKLRNLGLAVLGLGMAIGVGGALAAAPAVEVDAAASSNGYSYILSGSGLSDADGNAVTDWECVMSDGVVTGGIEFVFDSSTSTFSATVSVNVGSQFKIVGALNTWGGGNWWMGYKTTCIGDNYSGYFSNSDSTVDDANIAVTVAGTYTITIAENFCISGKNTADNITVTKADATSVAVTYDVTVEGAYIEGETATSGVTYIPKWILIDGYRITGYYSDSGYTQELDKSGFAMPDQESLTIYVKTEVAPADYTIYYEGGYTHAYWWRSAGGYCRTGWPGEAMTGTGLTTTAGTTIKSLVIPGEYDIDHIIFNDGKETGALQTADLAYVDGGAFYDDDGAIIEGEEANNAVSSFFAAWLDGARDADGSICWLLEDTGSEKLDALKTLYANVTDEGKTTILSAISDATYEGVGKTVYDSMEYLVNASSSVATGYNVNAFSSPETYIGATIAILFLVGVGAYFLLRKKKVA